MGHLQMIAFKKLELGLIKFELILTRGLFKFQKALNRISSAK
jgi:hypothetical protein